MQKTGLLPFSCIATAPLVPIALILLGLAIIFRGRGRDLRP
jgi:hypothetical protein